MFLTHPPGDERLFVVALGGDIRVVKANQLVATPFLSLGERVAVGGAQGDERGLLGMAFHPDYVRNGLFYVHYSDGKDANDTGDSIIEEYKVSSNPDVADATSARLVLKVEQPTNGNAAFRNHKGGAINFGPDGYLYIGLGDGGGSNDSDTSHGTGNGQNVGSLLGKILRIDPVKSGDKAYAIPPGNLKDTMSAAAPEVWDYGLRNPFRASFDKCTGDLYIGDVGQNQWEEIDIEKAGEGHKDYGWNRMEGLHCFSPQAPDTSPADCDKTGLTSPFVEVPDEQGTSITGGSVYRGKKIPALRGAYFYADYVSNKVWWTRYDRNAGTVSTPVSVTQELNAKSIVAIENGVDGELYFVSLGTITGNRLGPGGVYKLENAE